MGQSIDNLTIVSDDEQGFCVGCDFIAEFSPHEGGYCQVHGTIPPTDDPDVINQSTVIRKLGGDKLELVED